MAGNTPQSEFEQIEPINTATQDDNPFAERRKPETEPERQQEPQPEPRPRPREYESFKELGLDKPSPFTGERTKIEIFIQECRVYLQINKRIYTTDDAKVAFFLSLMKDKEALRWKQTYLKSITNQDGDIEFPAIKDFVALLLNHFQPMNQVQDAAHQITMLKQGKKTAEEIIMEFRLLTAQAGYTTDTPSDHLHLVGKLQNILNPSLVKKIMLLEKPPTTINKWAYKAIQIDGQYRATMDILNRRISEGRTDKGKSGGQKWMGYFGKKKEERDPNAMDIDAMTTEKRTALMKKGACFICEEQGHMAKDHNEHMKKKKANVRGASTATPSTSTTTSSSKPKTVKEIHALLQAMTTEQMKELLALQAAGQEKEDDSDF